MPRWRICADSLAAITPEKSPAARISTTTAASLVAWVIGRVSLVEAEQPRPDHEQARVQQYARGDHSLEAAGQLDHDGRTEPEQHGEQDESHRMNAEIGEGYRAHSDQQVELAGERTDCALEEAAEQQL